jgi:hypothetical protein
MKIFIITEMSPEQAALFLHMVEAVVGQKSAATETQINLLSAMLAHTANAILQKLDEGIRYEIPPHLPTLTVSAHPGQNLIINNAPGLYWTGPGANN